MDGNPWQDLYLNHSDLYDRLVRSEDYKSHLVGSLRQIHSIDHKEVVEFGAGTGRVTLQLAPHAKSIWAFDLTPPMIQVAHGKLRLSGYSNWYLGVADSRAVPVPAACADIAIEGWSFVQIMAWHMDTWRQEVGQAIKEMLRVLRPGGVAVLIETLGTGETTPHPPDRFIPVYEYFESEWHLSSTWIRTDYRFPTLAEARATLGPVFGESMLERVIESVEGFILPECTGIWWRTV